MFTKSTYFTELEARAMIGRRVRTRVAWSGIPVGTTGRIVDTAVIASGNGWRIAIGWDLKSSERQMIGWFTRNDYELELEEVPVS